jgi:putative membrane protein
MLDALGAFQDVSTQWRGYGWGMHPGMGWGYGYGMSWTWEIAMVVFWIAVIVGIIFLIRWFIVSTRSGSHTSVRGDSAQEILKMRYARGEINKGEFEQMKRDLMS